MGRKYIAINDLEVDKPQAFEFYFELREVGSYEVVITDHKEDDDLEISLVPEEWTKPEIIMGTIFDIRRLYICSREKSPSNGRYLY